MKFDYTAKDERGVASKGVIEAQDSKSAVGLLKERKLFPIKVQVKRSLIDVSGMMGKFSRVTSGDVANITRQLSTMITAGLPITDALNLLKNQSGLAMAAIMGGIVDDVAGGSSLSEALSKHPEVFSKVYVASVRAGEAAGMLETILNRLADGMEKSQEFLGKVKGAMIYPAIILIGMVGVMVLMMVVVIPKLTEVYKQFNSDLPLATQVVIGLSNFMVRFWWLVIGAGVGIVVGIRAYINTEKGGRIWENFLRRIPIVGKMMNQAMLTELTRTLSLLVGAGVAVVEALEIVSEVVNSRTTGSELKRIAQKVEKGFPMSICFTESETFPPIVGQMVAVGEETGKLDEVLSKLSHYFEVQSEQTVKGLTTAIEPIIMVILGVGVGFLVYTIIMPIYDITNKL